MLFVLREEFAYLFQTFFRSDPPGKAPLTRGRYVFLKKAVQYLVTQIGFNTAEHKLPKDGDILSTPSTASKQPRCYIQKSPAEIPNAM